MHPCASMCLQNISNDSENYFNFLLEFHLFARVWDGKRWDAIRWFTFQKQWTAFINANRKNGREIIHWTVFTLYFVFCVCLCLSLFLSLSLSLRVCVDKYGKFRVFVFFMLSLLILRPVLQCNVCTLYHNINTNIMHIHINIKTMKSLSLIKTAQLHITPCAKIAMRMMPVLESFIPFGNAITHPCATTSVCAHALISTSVDP